MFKSTYDRLVNMKYSVPQISILVQFDGLINGGHEMRRYFYWNTEYGLPDRSSSSTENFSFL